MFEYEILTHAEGCLEYIALLNWNMHHIEATDRRERIIVVIKKCWEVPKNCSHSNDSNKDDFPTDHSFRSSTTNPKEWPKEMAEGRIFLRIARRIMAQRNQVRRFRRRMSALRSKESRGNFNQASDVSTEQGRNNKIVIQEMRSS
jgi:hypothetical protein